MGPDLGWGLYALPYGNTTMTNLTDEQDHYRDHVRELSF